LPNSSWRSASARRQLFAVITATFIILSLVIIMTALADQRVRKPALTIVPLAPSTSIVISQVYGGAGCGTAGCSTFKNDYIELFNRGASAQSLNGWSVQYAAATGTAWQVTSLTNVTLQPGQYYLVAESAGANGVNNLPTPDTTGTIAMSATAAKVALVNTTTALSGACPASASIVDLIGYGTTANCFETAVAPAPSTTTADVRAGAGCTDTDNNSTDFTATTPNPRNTSTALNSCGGGGTTTLNIGDVTQSEGNAGQTAFNFTVSLTAPAGASGVTFNASTADGTTNPANAGSDYTALTNQPFTITQGNTSTTVTVQVNGDTTVEPNETFFVNISGVTGATAGDAQGLGTITNDDVVLTGICQIQGSGVTSPVAGQSASTRGIVTGIKLGSSGGFYIQDDACDADPNTSNGLFVFTGASVPAAAVVGNSVQVSGTVQEFSPSADPNQKPQTELSGTVTASVLSTGNPLPAPTTISTADTQVNNLENLERFEGMRVQVNSLTVVAPTQGTINEPNATVTSNGVFYGVVTGVARPFREPGINASDPLPAGAPANIPRFDENPERLRVDSDGQPGTTAVNVSTGTIFSNVVGEMDYSFRTWTILPEQTLTGGTNGSGTPAPAANANEFTVASFNMERFFDTTDDPNVNPNVPVADPVLTTTAFNNRLNKASLIIRTIQQYPDVIGVEEMEHLSTLQAVANKVNADAVADGQSPNYQAYLVEGNDVGGIDVGFLVKASRINVVDVTQIEQSGCDHITPSTCNNYIDPTTNAPDILNDRPPLVLRATIARPAGGTLPFTVIVNHLRSLSGVDDATVQGSATAGGRVREKRRKQAEFLANYIQSRQAADPTEKIITVGDMNAFRINDGYVDVIGTILGTPAPADQVVLASSDLVNPDQTDLVDTLPADQRYSYSFDGNAQTLDHVIVNPNAHAILDRFVYAREDADQPVKDYEDPNIPDRISDHDQPIAYFSLGVPQPAGSVIVSEFRFRGPGPSDVPPAAAPQTGKGIVTFKTLGSLDVVKTNAPGTSGENDEFIEFYNNTDSDITVATTDGSPGWALVASDGQTRFIIPNGTVIVARRHYLAVNTDGYSLAGYATPNDVLLPDGVTTASGYTQEIPDGSGIALFRTADPSNFNTGDRLDAAGYTTVPALYREGNGLPTGGAEIGNDLEYSWERQQCAFVNGVGCTTPGTPKDTGDNATDFVSVDTTGVVQSLGAPGPESSGSPYQRNSEFPVALLDPNRTASQSPNRVRDFTQDPANNSAFGTLSIRRTVTNNTGGPITYLAFRIVQITTSPTATPGEADLRALDSDDITVTLSNGTPVDVRGTLVEQPPFQPNGGGLNTSMAVGFLNLGGEVADGESINVQFLLGVQKTGTFRFYINVEAFDESSTVAPATLHTLKMQPQGAQRPRARGGR
jgi:predicted extracellular nuclease